MQNGDGSVLTLFFRAKKNFFLSLVNGLYVPPLLAARPDEEREIALGCSPPVKGGWRGVYVPPPLHRKILRLDSNADFFRSGQFLYCDHAGNKEGMLKKIV